ncbi:hypothetical protein [Campylobacter sputorum]|uniref:hypothetical protein n=1 Tax=Campylobacter sputorum TaxID=206 RepID=UPI000B78158A|nr:hypothetical protein [Campylobacter sputorum]
MKNLKFLAVLLVSPLFAGTYHTHNQDSDATYIQNHTTSLSDMFLVNVATTNTNTSAIGNIFM